MSSPFSAPSNRHSSASTSEAGYFKQHDTRLVNVDIFRSGNSLTLKTDTSPQMVPVEGVKWWHTRRICYLGLSI